MTVLDGQMDIFEFVENIPVVQRVKKALAKPTQPKIVQYTIFDELALLEGLEEKKCPVVEQAVDEFPPLEEQLAAFHERLLALISKPNVHWYKDVLPVTNHFMPKYQRTAPYGLDATDRHVIQTKQEVVYEVLHMLGLAHFKQDNSIAGHKREFPYKKFIKQHELDSVLAKKLVACTTVEEVFACTSKYYLYGGKNEKNGLPNLFMVAPSDFVAVCLTQATDTKDVLKVLDYCGFSYNGCFPKENTEVILPNSETDFGKFYFGNLTESDIELVKKDFTRLGHLKNRVDEYEAKYQSFMMKVAYYKEEVQ